ncbi:MAG: hypothetical protein MUF06_07875 [Pirellulaceae bacterium]|nr:hypothetical protein [Pirellulaceae bacterium]
MSRTRRIVAELTGLSEASAESLLAQCGGELKTAVVAQRLGIPPEQARERLSQHGGHLRQLSRHAGHLRAALAPDDN